MNDSVESQLTRETGSDPRTDVVYLPSQNLWHCCGVDAQGQVTCSDPSGMTFTAPAANDLLAAYSTSSTVIAPSSTRSSPTASSLSSAPAESSNAAGSQDQTSSSISGGTIAGIVVGAVAAIIALIVLGILWHRRRRRHRYHRQQSKQSDTPSKYTAANLLGIHNSPPSNIPAEKPTTDVNLSPYKAPQELGDSRARSEMFGGNDRHGVVTARHEMAG